MTREELIALARKAGFADGMAEIMGLEGFARFAALVAAHERELCAQVCDNTRDDEYTPGSNVECAAAIRSRT